jgi:hypothetical protein
MVNESSDLKELRENVNSAAKVGVPAGFIEVHLSTKGLIGAPESFHIRNLSTEDLMLLGLAEENELPIKAIEMLNRIILEHKEDGSGVNIEDFHEKEVMELILTIYETFYTDTLHNLTWTYTEEDWEFLKQQYGGEDTEEFRSHERNYHNDTANKFKPKFEINLATGVSWFDIDPNIRTNVRVTGRNNFTVKFGLPKYGDVITLKNFIEVKYKERDKQFNRIGEILKKRQDAEARILRGENINLNGIGDVPKAERDKYREYEVEKSIFALSVIKAYHLLEMNHIDPANPDKVYDVSDLPLEKRMELAKSPEIDHSLFDQVQKMFSNLEFGIKEEITVNDPVMNKVVKRKYSFQLIDLLQAIRDQRPSEVVLSYE